MSLKFYEVNSEYILEGEYRSVAVTEKLTEQLLDLPDRPTCIIAPDDYSALGVLNVANRRGLKVPDDISVAGYDGIPYTSVLEPNLTTVKQDVDKIGSEAAKRLISLIESPMTTSLERISLKSQLIKGGSVARI